MTFNELKLIIEHLHNLHDKAYYTLDDLRVCIPVEVVGVVGGTPCVDVKYVTCGFDWDNGKLMIIPNVLLRETTRDEIKDIRDKYEELANHMRTIRELKKENKKLKEQLNTKNNDNR